ncbi:DUF881 domain-containing protein [bacterium 210820-DFI.6.37]|nr:DUF881 domain-containing protein [bacterium 210820-DFI.6.37]
MKKRTTAGLLALCFLIGFGIILQARMTDGERLYVSQKTIGDYKAQIQGEKQSLEEIQELTRRAREDLTLYSRADGGKLQNALKEELLKNKILAGTQAVRGKGVIITVDDGTGAAETSQELNNLLVHDNDILRIINELKASGAEAISVNGQRIAEHTSISCAGYTVRINGRTYARPFVIQAVGDSTRMTDRLIGVGGYGKELREWGVRFQIQSGSDIRIPALKKEMEYQYMKEEKEDQGS